MAMGPVVGSSGSVLCSGWSVGMVAARWGERRNALPPPPPPPPSGAAPPHSVVVVVVVARGESELMLVRLAQGLAWQRSCEEAEKARS